MRTVVGLFDNANEAQRTIDELVRLGFAQENISVITNTSAQPSLASGTSGFDTIMLNDVGKVAAKGPIRAAMGEGGPASNLAGALQRFGLTPDLAQHYVSGVQHGETLETIVVDDADADRVVEIMKRHSMAVPNGPTRQKPAQPAQREERISGMPEEKGQGIAGGMAGAGAMAATPSERAEQPRPSAQLPSTQQAQETRRGMEPAGMAPPQPSPPPSLGREHDLATDEELRIPVVREELRVGKRTFERGNVRITVHTVERPTSEQILLRESKVEIERRPSDRVLGAGEVAFKDDTIELSEIAEEPVVSKQARLVEEFVVHKKVREHVETVSDNVRSTEVDIERIGFDAARYREHFDAQHPESATFEEYLPAYQFGHELHRPGEPARRWEDIEHDARTRWEERSPGTWERFKDSIKYAFGRARGS